MDQQKELLTNWIKQCAGVFLLDAAEFFPFGAYINRNNEVQPCSAYIEDENDRPPSSPLINILEEHFLKGIKSNEILIAAIGVDIFINENGEKYDGLQIRFFENGTAYIETFKYVIKDNVVDYYK